jgi:hypothetical protein
MKKRTFVLLGAASLIFMCAASWAVRVYIPQRRFTSLLNGNESVSVICVKLGQAELKEPNAVNYLSRMFRSASGNGTRFRSGYSRAATIKLSTGEEIKCNFLLPPEEDLLVVGYPTGGIDSAQYYEVALEHPVPELVKSFFFKHR